MKEEQLRLLPEKFAATKAYQEGIVSQHKEKEGEKTAKETAKQDKELLDITEKLHKATHQITRNPKTGNPVDTVMPLDAGRLESYRERLAKFGKTVEPVYEQKVAPKEHWYSKETTVNELTGYEIRPMPGVNKPADIPIGTVKQFRDNVTKEIVPLIMTAQGWKPK
jgi:hypothetical protein